MMFKRRAGVIATILLIGVLILFGALAKADSGGTTGLGFDDAYTQIVNHHIPIEPDGKPTYFPGGRHYTGPNGWEIRLNHGGTMAFVQVEQSIVTVGGGVAIGVGLAALGTETAIGAVVVSAVDTTAWKLVSGFIGDLTSNFVISPAVSAALKGRCLGITIPKEAIPQAFNRSVLLTTGQITRYINLPGYNDAKVWFENCAPDDKSAGDVVSPPAPPAAKPADTQAAKSATSMPPQPSAKKPASTPQKTMASAPPKVTPGPQQAPTYRDVSMNTACVNWYGSGYTAEYTDPNRADSWVCKDPSGVVRGGLRVQEDFCDRAYPGSTAVIVQDDQIPAYWWKCKL